MADIITAPVSAELPSKDSGIKKMHKESEGMLGARLAFGNLELLLKAGALFTYAEHALYRLDGFKTMKEFVETIGVNDRTSRKYIQIARMMKKACGVSEDDTEFAFTAPVIKQHFGEAVKCSNLTVNGLAEASRNLQIFENYLLPENSEHIPEEIKGVIAAPKKSEQSSERKPVPYTSAYMQKFAEEHGLTWNGHEWVNPDGSALTEKQRALLTRYEEGIKVWEDIERATGEFLAKLIGAIERDGSAFERYNSIGNEKFADQVRSHNINISTAVRRVDETLHALCVHGVQAAVGIYNSDIQL